MFSAKEAWAEPRWGSEAAEIQASTLQVLAISRHKVSMASLRRGRRLSEAREPQCPPHHTQDTGADLPAIFSEAARENGQEE